MNGISMDSIIQEYIGQCPDDDDRMVSIKAAIKELSKMDVKLLVMYMETGGYAQLGRYLNVSSTTARKRIETIRGKILLKLNNFEKK